MTWQEKAISFVQTFEDFNNVVYDCGDGLQTVGWGVVLHGEMAKKYPFHSIVPLTVCAKLFDDAIATAISCANDVKTILDDNVRAAIVEFAYNCGLNAWSDSTFKKRVLANDVNAPDELLKWVNSDHKVNAGLQKRRICSYLMAHGREWHEVKKSFELAHAAGQSIAVALHGVCSDDDIAKFIKIAKIT